MRWAAEKAIADTPAHSRHEHRKPTLGCAADPWRTPQARHRCWANHSCQVHGEGTTTAVPRLEDVSAQSRGWHRIDGFIRGCDDLVPFVVWICDRATSPPRDPMAGCHRSSNRRMAGPSGHRGLRMGEYATLYPSRPDGIYGAVFLRRLRAMGIRDRPTEARSPWQYGYCERLIGSIRRDCLNHVVVFGERHLRHLLRCYATYYNETRTHLSLSKDAPVPRPAQILGRIFAVPILGGLHHQYVRV